MDNRKPSWLEPVAQPTAIGLSVVVDPDSPTLDVVFVHGFNGDSLHTWRHKTARVPPSSGQQTSDSSERPSKMPRLMSVVSHSSKGGNPELVYWPKHLLPETLPSARVLVYGYDTKIRHALGAPISKNTVYDIASDFLGSLEAQRRSEPSRPLVFIAHSLGGIVVKELLRRSYGFSDHQRHLHQIYKATSAIIFFGTPHGGADPRGFREHLIEQVVRAAGLAVNEQIVSTLLPTSERLRELRDEFGSLARRQGWIVYSFQEQYGVRALGRKKVVEDVSSCLGNPELEITQHIASDHRDMCRFGGLHDNEYTKVAAALEYIRNRLPTDQAETRAPDPALKSEQRQSILDALSFRAIDARYSTVKAAHARTCRWLLQRPEYRDWCDATMTTKHHGLLWIKGKPGSGKSTLVKFAVQNARKANKEAKVICFFFNARGEDLEKTTLGMYRTLLLQLLLEFPDLQVILDSFRLTRVPDGDSYTWRQSDLQSLFEAAIRKLGQRQLLCFVDALDECDEDQIRDLVLFLGEIGRLTVSSRINFRACLSSRHYPYISIEKGIELTLEGQEGHVEDIARYLDCELKAGKGNQIKAIKDEILTRASGIFLWVALVVQILNKEYDHGRVHALRKRLKEIPDGLDKLFEDILTRDRVNSEELVLCLQWILYSKRPLKREELYYAILSGTDGEALTTLPPETITAEDMERFILSCSKGLAETTKLKSRTVQFIHESVRDFLLGKNGFSKLRSELAAGQSHDRLKQCCCIYSKIELSDYLPLGAELPKASSEEAKDLRARVSMRFPFLEYAVHNVLVHADSADKHGVSQASFVHDFSISDWIVLYNLLERYQVRRYDKITVSNLLYISTKSDLPHLVRTCMQTLWDSYQEFVAGCLGNATYTASVTAALRDPKISDYTVRALLLPTFQTANDDKELFGSQRDCDFNNEQDAVEMIIKKRSSTVPFQAQHIYSWAASGGHHTVIRLLLARIEKQPRELDDQGRTPLILAASHGHVAVVKMLLGDCFFGVSVSDAQGRTPLSWAASNGHVAVVNLLLGDMLFTTNGPDRKGRTPLSWAASNGHADVVKILLRHDPAEYSGLDKQGRSPLSYAASNGHEEIVRLLLAGPHRSGSKGPDYAGRTPLSWAASNGHLNVAKILLSHRPFDSTVRDTQGRLPLSWAASNGHEEIVKLLLTKPHRSDSEGPDYAGRTPLSWAAANGQMAVEELLLESSDRLSLFGNLSDSSGRTLLSWAAGSGQQAVVDLLLANDNVDVNAYDLYGRTSLSYAAMNGHTAIVELLVAKTSVSAGHADVQGRTPLLHAASKGHAETVRLLLTKTAMFTHESDNEGRTPLSWAAEKGHNAVVHLLLTGASTHVHEHFDCADKQGWTPLRWAAFNGRYAIINSLLATGRVGIQIEDPFVGFALYKAASHGYLDEAVLNLLRRRGLQISDPPIAANGLSATDDVANEATTSKGTVSEIPSQ